MRFFAKQRKTGKKAKILLIEFDNNGYMQEITVRLDNKFHKKFFGYRDIKITDENGNEIKLCCESCDMIAKRGTEA